jgi:hypothetical protein
MPAREKYLLLSLSKGVMVMVALYGPGGLLSGCCCGCGCGCGCGEATSPGSWRAVQRHMRCDE